MKDLKKGSASLGNKTPLTVEERVKIAASKWAEARAAKDLAVAEMDKAADELEAIVAANREELLGDQKMQRVEDTGVKVGYKGGLALTYNNAKYQELAFANRFPDCVAVSVNARRIEGLMRDRAMKLLLEEEFGVSLTEKKETFSVEKA